MSWKMTLQDLLSGTGGTALSTQAQEFYGIGTDTREDLTGRVFIALRGETFDAHEFLTDALKRGAAAIVVDHLPPGSVGSGITAGVTVVRVEDTLMALQRLGQFWRRRMSAKVLGVTGTNGKTTTKEFTAAILATRKRVQYSKGSFNNHWGVPLSLLSIAPEHEVAIIEMGMNHRGEIQKLVEIAEPDAVLVTMVGRGHLEGLGSIEGVASAKEEIYLASSPGCTRIFNLDNPWTRKMYERARAGQYGSGRVWTFGSGPDTVTPDVSFDVRNASAEELEVSGVIRGEPGEARVPVFGAHNLNNLMAAAAFALECGLRPVEIWRALPECRAGWGRNQWVNLASGGRVLFDAYNANPESMRAAILGFQSLAAPTGGRKIAVIGEMREMGDQAASVHREIGEAVGRAGFDLVCFVGPSGADFEAGLRASPYSKNIIISNSYEQFLASQEGLVIDRADIVLMKGSRGVQLERILKDWEPLDFHK